jgi:hypothetical protein
MEKGYHFHQPEHDPDNREPSPEKQNKTRSQYNYIGCNGFRCKIFGKIIQLADGFKLVTKSSKLEGHYGEEEPLKIV